MKSIFPLLLLFTVQLWSQVEITNIVHQSNNGQSIGSGFAVVAEAEAGFSIFFVDGKKIYANGFDGDYNYLSRLDSREISSREEYIAGKSYGDNYHLFFKVRVLDKLLVQTFNFTKDTVTENLIPLDIRDQEILQYFEHDNKVNLLTVGTKQDVLFLHSIDENFETSSQKIPIDAYVFYNEKHNKRPFHKVIFDNFQEISGIGMNPSQATFPMTLPESTRPTKIYKQENQLVFTLDASPQLTQVLYVDIETGETSLKNIQKVSPAAEKSVKQSNSFLLDKELYQIVRRDDVLEISVKNSETGDLLNTFELSDGEEFPYTNTATLTLKPSKKKRKEVSPSQFLRFAKYDPLGIYATNVDGATQITYGTWDKERGNNGSLNNSKGNGAMVGVMTVSFGIVGGILYAALSSGNSIQSYGLHHVGMTTRAIGVFDKNFQHLPDKGVQANIYHRIDYYNSKQEDTTPFLLFQFKDTTIYGSFYPEQNAVKLLKF
ncbi:hypothetical protein [Rasiella sp. SM2506]|uniref:hypothetical protein n=1 Tax=Rasiella sp. SM2506 TaxID=3423914 RepID=UPI003D792773